MNTALQNRVTGWISEADARVLCYVLGPVSGAWVLHQRRFSSIWSVRFHAIHSLLMSSVWLVAWATLRLIEEISPWFFATLIGEIRFVMNLCFLLGWMFLLVAAYQGERCAILPFIHRLSVKLARKTERHAF
jgi:uncharacterized membrane protein